MRQDNLTIKSQEAIQAAIDTCNGTWPPGRGARASLKGTADGQLKISWHICYRKRP